MSLPLTSSATVVQKRRVLVVDDEREVLDVVVHILRENGFDACSLEDPGRIQARVEEVRPDLVIMDFEMPRLSGSQASLLLKSNPASCHIPIVFLSGYADGDHRMAGVFSGAAAFLAKPVNEFVLVEVIRRILGVSNAPA